MLIILKLKQLIKITYSTIKEMRVGPRGNVPQLWAVGTPMRRN